MHARHDPRGVNFISEVNSRSCRIRGWSQQRRQIEQTAAASRGRNKKKEATVDKPLANKIPEDDTVK